MKISTFAVTLGTAALVPVSAFATDDIEVIEVTGRAQQFYLDTETTVGSKTPIELLELPFSAQVLSEQLIKDQAARDITDLYRSVAGVSEYSYSGVTFRGFRDDANVFYDGVRGDPFSGFSVPQLFSIDRVEVLKGPAAAIYGGGEPGGMINYVTKKPTFNQQREIVLTGGSDSLWGGSIDMTGGLTENVAFRLGAFYEEQDSFRNNADKQYSEISGGLLYQIGENTDINATFQYIKQDLGGHRLRGVPVDDDGNFLVDPSYNANEASDFQDLEAWVLQSQLSHYFSDNFRMNATVRYFDNNRDQAYHESRGWVDVNGDGVANVDDKTIRREYRDQHRGNEELSLTLDFMYDVSIADFEHQILFGGDYQDVETEYDYLRARYEGDGVANLNIFTLNYGQTNPANYTLKDLNRDGIERERHSFYLQDRILLTEQWSVMLGARYDSFDETDNDGGENSYSDSDISYRAGITWQPADTLSIYANYSESFNPVSADDFDEAQGLLEPTTGEQIELGIKKQWLDGRILTTLAVYSIDKENLVQGNPDYIDEDETPNLPQLINFGLVESDGAEFVFVGDISELWSVTANYAYNETKVKQGDSRNTSGSSRFVNAPKHQAGLWTRYALESIDSSVAFGLNYVGEQFSSDDQRVKPFTVFDASWTTQWDDLLLSINIHNLFDKEYAVSGFSERNGHFPGAPREVVAQLSYQF